MPAERTSPPLPADARPGYERPGCSPLGPNEPRFLNDPDYDPAACSMSDRMAKVKPFGRLHLEGDNQNCSGCTSSPGERAAKPSSELLPTSRTEYASEQPAGRPLQVTGAFDHLPSCAVPLPRQNRDGTPFRTYTQALAALPSCFEVGGLNLVRGTCSDGKRFIAQHETFEGEGETRFYQGERLVGVARESYIGGAECGAGVAGDVVCRVAQRETACSEPAKPNDCAPPDCYGGGGGAGAAGGSSRMFPEPPL